jgi:hypothetical protein
MCMLSYCRQWITLWIGIKLVRCCVCCVGHYSLKVAYVRIVHAPVMLVILLLLLLLLVAVALLAGAAALAVILVLYQGMAY